MFHPLGQVLRYKRIDVPSIPKTPESDTTCKKTESTALRFFEGLFKSKVTRALLITGAVVAAPFLLVSNPISWVATALGVSLLAAAAIFACVAIGIFGLCLLAQKLLCDGTLEFELSAAFRLTKKNDYNQIAFPEWAPLPNTGPLYLGSMPNRIRPGDVEALFKEGGGAVLSINEEWERQPLGLNVPYSAQDWREKGVTYFPLEVKDHTLMDVLGMELAANLLHYHLSRNAAALVHCRAGVGRSATAIAAYLMKHGKDKDGNRLTIEAICTGITSSRKKATIWNKLEALRNYDEYLKKQGYQRPDRSPIIDAVIEQKIKGKMNIKACIAAGDLQSSARLPKKSRRRPLQHLKSG